MEATKREKRRREDATEEASPEPFEFPPEIIREILLRLPTKSIGRFRCVSKLFRSLSSDPSFAKIHLDLTVHRKLIVSGHNLYALDFDGIGDSFQGLTDLVAVELNYPLKEVPSKYGEFIQRIIIEDAVVGQELIDLNKELYRSKCVQMIGYSNGLVCISPARDAFFLYNPTTGASKRLPDLDGGKEYQTHGFGYDDRTDDYKVVKLVADLGRVRHASVYSSKSDSWRRVCDLNYGHDIHDAGGFVAGVNVSGAVHWVFVLEEADKRVVLAFDVTTEEFREVPLPGEAEDVSRNFVAGDYNGRLCVINTCCEKRHDDIWVMNEYGVASSWTRIRFRFLYRCMRPMCSTNNSDEVLLVSDEEMVVYNLRTKAWRVLRISGANLSGGFETHTYVESLISPNSYGVEN